MTPTNTLADRYSQHASRAIHMVNTSTLVDTGALRGHFIRCGACLCVGVAMTLASGVALWSGRDQAAGWLLWALLSGLAIALFGGILLARALALLLVHREVQSVRLGNLHQDMQQIVDWTARAVVVLSAVAREGKADPRTAKEMVEAAATFMQESST